MPITRTRELYTSPEDDIKDAAIAFAQSATESLHYLAYGFTLHELAQIMADKMAAGLSTGAVIDRTQAAGSKEHLVLQWMVDQGCDVVITTSTEHSQIMHEKVILKDLALGASANESASLYGSFNFSDSAQYQANHAQTDNDPSVCTYFWKQYNDMRAYGIVHCPQLTPNPAGKGTPVPGSATVIPVDPSGAIQTAPPVAPQP